MDEGADEGFVRLLTRTAKAMREVGAMVLARHGVYIGQDLVLEVLAAADGQTPGEVAARLGVSGPTVVKMAQRMEAAGLVSRQRNDRDGRLVRIYLTDAGRARIQPIRVDLRVLGEQATAGLSVAERAELHRMLRTVVGNLRALTRDADGRDRAPAQPG